MYPTAQEISSPHLVTHKGPKPILHTYMYILQPKKSQATPTLHITILHITILQQFSYSPQKYTSSHSDPTQIKSQTKESELWVYSGYLNGNVLYRLKVNADIHKYIAQQNSSHTMWRCTCIQQPQCISITEICYTLEQNKLNWVNSAHTMYSTAPTYMYLMHILKH